MQMCVEEMMLARSEAIHLASRYQELAVSCLCAKTLQAAQLAVSALIRREFLGVPFFSSGIGAQEQTVEQKVF